MSSISAQVDAMETGLSLLEQQFSDLPMLEILTSRLLIYFGREMNTRLDQQLKTTGLTDIEFRTLMYVFLHSRVESCAYPSELCSSLAQSPANMTRLTDALVTRELITRIPDAQDRRRLVLQTTPAGDALVQQLMPTLATSLRRSFGDFDPADLQTLVHILKRLATVLDKTPIEPITESTP